MPRKLWGSVVRPAAVGSTRSLIGGACAGTRDRDGAGYREPRGREGAGGGGEAGRAAPSRRAAARVAAAVCGPAWMGRLVAPDTMDGCPARDAGERASAFARVGRRAIRGARRATAQRAGVPGSGRAGATSLAPLLAPSFALALVAAGPAAAAQKVDELGNLDNGLPNALDDAFAAETGSVELQGAVRYDRIRGRDVVRLFPRLQVGVAPGFEAGVSLPYTVGSGRDANRGGAAVDLLYNPIREGRWTPALAVALDAAAPVGAGRRGVETGLAVIATKTLDPAVERRVHLDLAWLHRFRPDQDERRGGYRLAVGYSQRVSPDLVAILDYVRYRQDRGERDANLFEAGLHKRITDGVTLGAAIGAGVGRDSPRLRAVVSVQIDLGTH